MNKLLLVIFSSVFLLVACKGKTDSKADVNEVAYVTKNTVKLIYLTKAEFLTKVSNYEANPNEWIYIGDKPALIDFYADWCGPCKAIAPVLDDLAAEYGDQIYIYKIDTDKESELAALFGIRSIPSLLFVPMTGKPQMTQGAMPKDQLKANIDKYLLNK